MLTAGLCLLLGRRNLVRLSRFLLNYARLDLPNDMDHNGEVVGTLNALRP